MSSSPTQDSAEAVARVVAARRSVRSFSASMPGRADVERIIAAGLAAPHAAVMSPGGALDRRFFVLPSASAALGAVARAIQAHAQRALGAPDTPPPSGDVPETILSKVAPRIVLAGLRPSAWPGEFRVVTAAYVRLRHPDYASPEDTLATLQDAAQRVQKCLARYEGQLYEIVAESEGVTFIAVFGLPPWSHEDDPARA